MEKVGSVANMFGLLYSIIFGALLSAQISSDHFKLESLKSFKKWLVRVSFLVVFPSLYLIILYYCMLPLLFQPPGLKRFLQLVGGPLMCLALVCLQQFSYIIVPPPHLINKTGVSKKPWVVLMVIAGLGTLAGLWIVFVLTA